VRDGAAAPRQDRWRGRSCHVTDQRPGRRATMHGAAQAFRHAMAIDAAKSVSFGKKIKQCKI